MAVLHLAVWAVDHGALLVFVVVPLLIGPSERR